MRALLGSLRALRRVHAGVIVALMGMIAAFSLSLGGGQPPFPATITPMKVHCR
jgi:hypothetical protein